MRAFKEDGMFQFMMIMAFSIFLVAATGWAQDTPGKRKHSRPPYSGPHKTAKGALKPRPSTKVSAAGQKGHKGLGPAKSDHILVR